MCPLKTDVSSFLAFSVPYIFKQVWHHNNLICIIWNFTQYNFHILIWFEWNLKYVTEKKFYANPLFTMTYYKFWTLQLFGTKQACIILPLVPYKITFQISSSFALHLQQLRFVQFVYVLLCLKLLLTFIQWNVPLSNNLINIYYVKCNLVKSVCMKQFADGPRQKQSKKTRSEYFSIKFFQNWTIIWWIETVLYLQITWCLVKS